LHTRHLAFRGSNFGQFLSGFIVGKSFRRIHTRTKVTHRRQPTQRRKTLRLRRKATAKK